MTDKPKTRRWAVLYAEGRSTPALWAIVEDVPAEVRTSGVRDALEAWQHWPSWQRRVSLGARIVLAPQGGPMWSKIPPGALVARVTRISWEQLAPAQRAMTIRVDSAVWARVRAAAAAEGVSIQAFILAAVSERLGAGNAAP